MVLLPASHSNLPHHLPSTSRVQFFCCRGSPCKCDPESTDVSPSFGATKWILSSLTGYSQRPASRSCRAFSTPSDDLALPRTTSIAAEISRTWSDAIDQRAAIANFYRHIQLERQVSLQLRRTKGRGFGTTMTPMEWEEEEEQKVERE
ncbi:hypothetical protein BHE74_00056902, partial [Ensete ventricosum]